MLNLTISDESLESSGARSIYFAAVDELVRRYGGADDAEHFTVNELAPPRGAFLVARLDGHLAGGVGLRPIGDRAALTGEIKRLWVRPDLRRGGAATALMNAIEERARQLDYHRLFLETGPRQPEAIAFYAKTEWIGGAQYPPGAFFHAAAHRYTKLL